jgi:hypothetical protein
MMQVERRLGYGAFSPHHARFRWERRRRLLLRNDADVDFAYSLVMAWTAAENEAAIKEKLLTFWDRTVEAFEYPSLWRRVDRIAKRLLTRGEIAVRRSILQP